MLKITTVLKKRVLLESHVIKIGWASTKLEKVEKTMKDAVTNFDFPL